MYEFAERFMQDSEFFVRTIIVSLLSIGVLMVPIGYFITEWRKSK